MTRPAATAGFTVVERELERRQGLARVRLGRAACLRFDAARALSAAVDLLRAGPAALLCTAAGCPVCVPARRLLADR